MDFKIVEFVEGGLAVIPTTWRFKDVDKCKCYWPGDKAATRQAKRYASPSDDWESYEIKILQSCDSFDDAFKKMKRLVRDTDISCSENEKGRGKRRMKKVHKTFQEIIQEPSESEMDQESTEEYPEIPVFANSSPIPGFRLNSNGLNRETNSIKKSSKKTIKGDSPESQTFQESSVDGESSKMGTNGLTSNTSEYRSKRKDMVTDYDDISSDEVMDEMDFPVGPKSNLKNQHNAEISSNADKNKSMDVSSRERDTSNKTIGTKILSSSLNISRNSNNRLTQNKNNVSKLPSTTQSEATNNNVMGTISISEYRNINRNFEIMKSNQRQIMETLDALLNSQTSGQRNVVSTEEIIELQEVFGFPLNTEEQLNLLEDGLNEIENVSKLRGYLKQFGGSTLYDCLKRILVHIFVDNLAREYSWEGRKGKKPLSNLRLMKIIIESVRGLKSFKESTIADIEKNIKSWFTHASDRIKSKELTAAKKLKK